VPAARASDCRGVSCAPLHTRAATRICRAAANKPTNSIYESNKFLKAVTNPQLEFAGFFEAAIDVASRSGDDGAPAAIEELLESPKFMAHLSNMYVCAPRTKLLRCRARKLAMPHLSLHRHAKRCSTA